MKTKKALKRVEMRSESFAADWNVMKCADMEDTKKAERAERTEKTERIKDGWAERMERKEGIGGEEQSK